MDFFNEIMKFGDIFESQETIDELKDISDEIKKYDVYDVLARISGLNLMPHNQNKSVLLDSLIAGIICEEENTYNSTYKMSAGKFKKLIGKINETNLALSIDPNENAFYQNVMLMDNYTVFRTKEGANIMKRYGYHRTSTREQHLDRGIKVIMMI